MLILFLHWVKYDDLFDSVVDAENDPVNVEYREWDKKVFALFQGGNWVGGRVRDSMMGSVTWYEVGMVGAPFFSCEWT